jgi:AmmeMemoRadiSam system protein B
MVEAPSEPSFPLPEQPRLRPIEIFPIEDRGQRGLLLRDPADPSVQPIVLSDGAAEVLMLLDGQRSIEGLSAALQLRGASITSLHLRHFLERLDEAGFLDSARARHRLGQRQQVFLDRPVRVAVHAGGAYPAGADELARTIADGHVDTDGPGAPPGRRDPAVAPPRGVIAPHVDLHRGAPTYSWAYKAVAEARLADLYVVLGTCHTPVEGSFAATTKPYDTPFGAMSTDASFLSRLRAAWGHDLFAGEFSHATEHSIEFQAVYLRSLGVQAPMVAILCDSLHSLVPRGRSPASVPLIADFVAALRETIASDGRSVTVIVAVDLAHVGRRFGDSWLVDRTRMARIDAEDRELLRLALAPDPEAYYQHVMKDRDARRICGFTPVYLLSALMDAPGEVLRYSQWVDADKSSSVTFASALFR